MLPLLPKLHQPSLWLPGIAALIGTLCVQCKAPEAAQQPAASPSVEQPLGPQNSAGLPAPHTPSAPAHVGITEPRQDDAASNSPQNPLGSYWLSQLPASTRLLVRVESPSWEANAGELTRWEKQQAGWRLVSGKTPVALGRSGLGWGVGLHRKEKESPQKREGDGRAPAGLFYLSATYGHGPGEAAPGALPHRALSESWHCVDDSGSRVYGQIVDEQRMPSKVRWVSSERMKIPLYELVVLVNHNYPGSQPGLGSCIFLHRFHAKKSENEAERPTAGCTALDEAKLRELAEWLRPGAVLAQLPALELMREAAEP